jgi:hypothetical protein
VTKTVAVDIGRQRPPRRDILSPYTNVLGLPLFLFAVIAGFYSAYLLLSQPDGSETPFPFFAFFLHVLAAFLNGLGVYVALGKHEASREGWALFTGIFSFLAGPVGVVGGILTYFLAKGQPRQMPLTEVVKAEMFVTVVEEDEPQDLQSMNLRISEQAQVEPIVDMLPLADIPTAIAIVNRLRERGEKTDIELIRKVSEDPRPEVYQYALSILDKMEKAFAGEVYALAQEIKGSPDEFQLKIDLAKLHIDYMQSGLLDESLTDYYWELTLSYLFEAMLAHPGKAELGADFAQLLAMQHLIPEASRVAKEVLKKEPSMMQAQLLVLQELFERAADHGEHDALITARKTALENSWAVSVPNKRRPGMGPTYDLARFWFGEEHA